MRSSNTNQLQAVRLGDGHAHYMGDNCWVLERHEEIDRRTHRHTFAITEEDRRVLLSLAASRGDLAIALGDGEAHDMGDGCFVLTRSEHRGRRSFSHVIGMTIEGLECLENFFKGDHEV